MGRIKVMISDRQKKIKVPTGTRMLIRRACNAVGRMENFEGLGEVGVIFVDDEQIRELNREHRNKDLSTDVLSFPLGIDGEYDINPETGAKQLGDIAISMEHAVDQAERYGHSFQREVGYLATHSMLHLLGYDHVNGGIEAMHMREKEEQVMGMLGLARDESYVSSDEE